MDLTAVCDCARRSYIARVLFGLALAATIAAPIQAADDQDAKSPATSARARTASQRTRQPWWQNAALKFKVDTGASPSGAAPHFWSKDESDQYLFCPSGFRPSSLSVLYSITNIVNATASSNVAPVSASSTEAFYGSGCWSDAWRGGGLSDELGIVLPGNYKTNRNTSLPLTGAWTRDVNVFTITNDSGHIAISALAFSHDSTRLYSSVYRDEPDKSTGKLYEWNVVGDLRKNGIGLTSSGVFQTSVSFIHTPSVYHIAGRDLAYYGEGRGGCRVCVYDPVARAETVLINSGLPGGFATRNITNVRVGGVRTGNMHLYVQCDTGALYVCELAADGKSIGPFVQFFSASEMHTLLRADWPSMCVFEVTDDETHAFFSHHPVDHQQENIQLCVVWSQPDT